MLVDAEGRVLLQERDEHAPIDPDRWGLSGGHLEPGEDPEAGAYRELEEETGVRLAPGHPRALRASSRSSTRTTARSTGSTCSSARVDLTDDDIDCHEGRQIVFVEPERARRPRPDHDRGARRPGVPRLRRLPEDDRRSLSREPGQPPPSTHPSFQWRTRRTHAARAPGAEFSEYVAAHRVRIVRTARLLTAGDHGAAEDLVQSALTRLYVHWPRVRRADDPVAYGFRTLTNAFLDERRRAHWRREVVSDDAPDSRAAGCGPRDALAGARRLAPSCPHVSVRWSCSATSCSTTSRPPPSVLGCSEGTVKSQNAKALSQLRERLGEQIPTEGTNR